MHRFISFVSILVLISFFDAYEGCSCEWKSSRRRVCDGDFVAKVRVRSGLLRRDGDYFFRIRRLRRRNIFKMPNVDAMTYRSLRRVYTERHSAECGVDLIEGNVYILSGRVTATTKRMWAMECNSLVETYPLSDKTKNLVRSLTNGTLDCSQGSSTPVLWGK